MSLRAVPLLAMLLLSLGGCGYITLSQIPCHEDSECPAEDHCGPAGFCAPGGAALTDEPGDTGGVVEPSDAASVADSGSPENGLDGGEMPEPDAGSVFDAGSPPDAGEAFDAGSPPDAGEAFDAGSPSDAGLRFDAGNPADAGHATDAGSRLDAGFFDAGMGGACLDNTDSQLLSQSSEQNSITTCAENNINYTSLSLNEPQALDCIEGTGLSTPCAMCVDAQAACTVHNCAYQCSAGTGTTGCQSCMNANCNAAFSSCSGL